MTIVATLNCPVHSELSGLVHAFGMIDRLAHGVSGLLGTACGSLVMLVLCLP